MRSPASTILATIVSLVLLTSAASAAPSTSRNVAKRILTDRVIVMQVPNLGNGRSVAISSEKGLVLVDTGPFPSVARKLRAAAERHFGRRDWAYVINTHGHDHVGGNVVFKDVPCIGHDNLVEELQTQYVKRLATEEERTKIAAYSRKKIDELTNAGSDSGIRDREAQLEFWQAAEREILRGFEVVFPSLTFSEDLTIHLGDRTLKASWAGKGHSTADIVIYVPEDRVLITGGACNPIFPKVSQRSTLADLRRWILVFDGFLKDGVQYLVPAHGEPQGAAAAVRTRDYRRDLLATLEDAHRRGLSFEQARATVELDERFPYMRDVAAYGGSRDEIHAANVTAVWKLLTE
jgi:glyoxylase-like metal-dependent hydrolase (beta-lactamase superfamily II)